jgi:hypothetical protein
MKESKTRFSWRCFFCGKFHRWTWKDYDLTDCPIEMYCDSCKNRTSGWIKNKKFIPFITNYIGYSEVY